MTEIDALIIDDDKRVLQVYKQYLEEVKIIRRIVVATDGISGMNKILNQHFGMIFLDLTLPKRDGMQIVALLKEAKSDALGRIIIASGNIDKAIMTKAIESGVKHFLVKPFTQDEFKQKVATLLKSISG